MAKTKKELIADGEELGLDLNDSMTVKEMEAAIAEVEVPEEVEETTDEVEVSDEDSVEAPEITEDNVDEVTAAPEEDEAEQDVTPEETPAEPVRTRNSQNVKETPLVEVVDRDKQTGRNTSEANVEAIGRSREQKIKDAWSKEEKVYRYIPLGIGEKKSRLSYVPVTVNGFRVIIPKGEQVLVPISVAKIIDDSMAQTERAGEQFKTDRQKTIEGLSIQDALA